MTNQEMISYIRQQISVGVSQEKIKTSLKSQGWSESDVNEGFLKLGQPVISFNTSGDSQNLIWTKKIPAINKTFMILSCLLVFGLDLLILISSLGDLIWFWIEMLAVIVVFAIFFYFERSIFTKKFANSSSKLDVWISILIVIRNLVFFLNFIPLIQLLGMGIIVYGGWAIGLCYLILIIARFKGLNKTN